MEDNSAEDAQVLKKIENYVFDLREKIGEGSFSRVYKGTNIDNNSTVAVKKVRVSDVKSKIAKRLLDWEVKTLRQVKHPNIIQCLDIHFSINNCYIITEFCEGGNLFEIVQKCAPLKEPSVGKIILSVSEALDYLSSLAIIHRDIKISNIFLSRGEYKVGDFGFAIKATSNFRDVTIGSPIYMSPEGLIHNIYGPKTDVWALGIMIYEILHGTTPLESCRSEEQLRKKVLEPPEIKVPLSEDLRQLLLGCLRPNEVQRMSIKDIAQSKYIKRVRLELEREKIYEKDLTATNKSTCHSLSSTSSSNQLSQLSPKNALALANYCRFTFRIAQLTKSSLLPRCLLWLTKHLARAKLYTNVSFNSQSNISRLIKEIRDTVLKEYGNKASNDFCIRELIQFCSHGSEKGKIGVYLSALGRESQILLKGLQRGCFEQFSSISRCQQYLQQLLFP